MNCSTLAIPIAITIVILLSTRSGHAFPVTCQGSATSALCSSDCLSVAQAGCTSRVAGSVPCQYGWGCAQQGNGTWSGTGFASCCKNGVIVADPHVRTADGLIYDFQAVGEFVLEDSDSSELQARMRAWGGCASVNSAAAVMVGTNRITVYAQETPPLRVNGNPTDISCLQKASATSVGLLSSGAGASTNCSGTMALADGGQVVLTTSNGVPSYSLAAPNGVQLANIAVRPGGYLDISVSPGSGATNGLLGSPDGDPTNDLTTRDGRVMPQPITFNQLYKDFGESWRVTQAESLFDYGPGEDTNTYTDRSFPAAPCPPPPEDKRLLAEQACQVAGITNKDLLHACVFDVTATGDTRFADSFVGIAEPRVILTVLTDEEDASSSATASPDDLGVKGCACRASGSTTRGFGWLGFLVPAVLLRRRRRSLASL